MIIWVSDGNANAIGFYEHLGGKRVAERKMRIGGEMHTIIGYGWDDLTRSFPNHGGNDRTAE